MSTHRGNTGTGTSDNIDPTDGWGEVPEADRPLWSRYMLDHCPAFPGATIMNFIAGSVVKGGTRVPQSWKDTAAELHSAGFSPLQYFLLAELLSSARKKGELQETAHGHLFKQWFGDYFPDFRLNAEAWRPWLERLHQAQSPPPRTQPRAPWIEPAAVGHGELHQRREYAGHFRLIKRNVPPSFACALRFSRMCQLRAAEAYL